MVICEAPSYVGALGVFRAYHAEVVHALLAVGGIDANHTNDTGGTALIRAQSALDALELEGDEATGVLLVRSAVEAPLRQLAANAGREGALIVEHVKKSDGSTGYDVAKDDYVDLIAEGVVDPTKVTRSALQNAASLAGLLLTTEAIITDIPEEEAPEAQGHDHGGGGMGF